MKNKMHPTPAGAARKKVIVYSASGAVLRSKTWNVKKLSSKKMKKS